jgi:hypothetical protein
MNIAQQLFVVFFAICWGTSSNAWPRWKPFHWTFVFELIQVRRRVGLSIRLLNVCPITYFAIVLAWIGHGGPNMGTLRVGDCLRLAVLGISPAFAVFGFYRIWFGVIECRSSLFYLTDKTLPPELNGTEPTSDTLKIGHRWWRVNVLFGALYVFLPLIAVWIFRYR